MLLQQPIDEAQQLHHAFLCTACIPEPHHQCMATAEFALLLNRCLSKDLAAHAAVSGPVGEQSHSRTAKCVKCSDLLAVVGMSRHGSEFTLLRSLHLTRHVQAAVPKQIRYATYAVQCMLCSIQMCAK